MRVAAYLAALFTAAGIAAVLSRPASPPVRETQRAQRIDVETFDRRWSPVHQMPPAVIIRQAAPVTNETATRDRAGKIDDKASKRTDICARHGMRRVIVGRGWRCRR